MDPNEKRELKRQAWRRLAAQRRRAGLLRMRVVVISLVCFALLWGVVFVQMATGNDPVLSAKEAAARTTASAARVAAARAAKAREPEVTVEEVEAGPAVAAGPAVEPEPAPEEVEPEFVEEEPLVTSQS